MKYRISIPTRGITHNKLEPIEAKNWQMAKTTARKIIVNEYETNTLLSIDRKVFAKARWRKTDEEDMFALKVPNSGIEVGGEVISKPVSYTHLTLPTKRIV